MLKRALLYAVVMFILLALAFSAGQWGKGTAQIGQQSEQIAAWLLRQESEAATGKGVGTQLVHRSDSVLSWSNNLTIPSKHDLKALAETAGRRVVRLPQGWFMANVRATGEGNTRTVLVPLRYDIPYNALSAKYAYPEGSSIGDNLLLTQESEADRPVVVEGSTVAWLSPAGAPVSAWARALAWLAWAIFGLVLFAFVYRVGQTLNARLGAWAGTGFVTATSAALLWLNARTGFTSEIFAGASLFQPNLAPCSALGHSVGDWLLGTAVLLFVTAFFHQSLPLKKERQAKKPNFALSVLSYLLAMGALWVGGEAMRLLVADGLFRFDLEYVLSLGGVGFAALTGALLMLAALFLFGHRMVASIVPQNFSSKQRWAAIGTATAVFAVCAVALAPSAHQALTVAAAAAVFAFGLDAMLHDEGAGFGSVMGWLVFFSLFASVSLFGAYTQKEDSRKISYAEALAAERDTLVAEKLLPRLAAGIQADSAALGRMLKPWPFKASAAEIRDFANRQVFWQNYLFQHYRLSAFAFDREEQPILVGQRLGHEQVVLGNWAAAKTVAPNVRMGRDPEGNLRYMVQANVNRMGDPAQPAEVYLFFDSKHPDPGKAFSQLFFNSPWQNLNDLGRYDFSVAHRGRLLVDQGLANRTVLGEGMGKGTATLTEGSGRTDAVAKSADGHTVAAVGRKTGGLIKLVYFFSVVFVLAALCLFFLALLNTITGFMPQRYAFKLSAKGSLTRRIHFWNVTLLAASFLVVGYLTYGHFVQSAKDSALAEFNYRSSAIAANLKAEALNTTAQGDSLRHSLVQNLASMAPSMGVDAHLYGPEGQILFSTQEELVRLGVLPSKMNPEALQTLLKTQQSECENLEKAAGMPYTAQYRPVQSGKGNNLAYLAIPYRQEGAAAINGASDFIGMLASLYVCLLLAAYGITLWLAKDITRPVRLLSDKVKLLRLEDKNEPLAYKGDPEDEISQLIEQYNEMVGKLEASKAQLVKLEREGAWREMARQVAHDIKNPLTTMKLSMQQLERVSGNPEQAAAYLRKAITRLIEQIDSLAQIASEFSMFANLDIKHKNDVVINEVVESVHDLFSEQKHVELSLSLPEERFHILGDKNHLIRVFNNLVINAIQAIPSDRQGKIRVSLSRHNGTSVIQISDNGGGIPPEIRDRVFEPNFTTKTSGSGLGLAICKKIIEAHDGTIRFETRDDEGTDFFVEVPITAVG